MSVRVPLIAEADATGDLAATYEDIRTSLNLPFVPDMFRLLSSRPDLLNAVLNGYRTVFASGVLERRTKEIIAAWTARLNECPCCVGTHNFFVLAYGGSPELTHAIETADGVDDLPLDDKTKSLLGFVEKVTRTPWRITDGDWAATRDAGWTEGDFAGGVVHDGSLRHDHEAGRWPGPRSSVDHSRISQLSQSESA